MSRRTHRAAVLAVLAAGALAGCSATPAPSASVSPSSPASPATADPAPAWVDRICTAGVTVATPAVARPALTGTDLATLQKAVSSYLGGVLAGIQQGRTQLTAAGPSPFAGADAAVARAQGVLDELAGSVTDARGRVDRADPRDPAGFATTLAQVRDSLAATKAPDALRDVLAVPGVAAVAGRSAPCTELQALAARVPG